MNWSKPRNAGGSGRAASFGGSVAYLTEEFNRVGDIQYLNLVSNTPKQAAREMETTAQVARHLQQRQGGKPAGNANHKPAYHFTLSWHPDDKPDPKHMMETGRHAIGLLGLQDHQAIIVRHTDRPHPHLHILANTIHPDTGRTARLGRDHLILNRWAHDYEKQHGIRSPKRAAKMEAIVPDLQKTKAEAIHRAFDAREAKLKAEHKEAAQKRKQERDDLIREFRQDKANPMRVFGDPERRKRFQERQKVLNHDMQPPTAWQRTKLPEPLALIMALRKAMPSFMEEVRFKIKASHEEYQAYVSNALVRQFHTPKIMKTIYVEAKRQIQQQRSNVRELVADFRQREKDLKARHEEAVKIEKQQRDALKADRTHAWKQWGQDLAKTPVIKNPAPGFNREADAGRKPSAWNPWNETAQTYTARMPGRSDIVTHDRAAEIAAAAKYGKDIQRTVAGQTEERKQDTGRKEETPSPDREARAKELYAEIMVKLRNLDISDEQAERMIRNPDEMERDPDPYTQWKMDTGILAVRQFMNEMQDSLDLSPSDTERVLYGAAKFYSRDTDRDQDHDRDYDHDRPDISPGR